MSHSSIRGLKLRLVLLTLGLYVPLTLAFLLVTSAHGYFIHLKDLSALPTLTTDLAFPVMGAGPGGHDALDGTRSPVFYLFWLPLFLGPLSLSLALARIYDRASLLEVAFQGTVGYLLVAATLFLALLMGIVIPFF